MLKGLCRFSLLDGFPEGVGEASGGERRQKPAKTVPTRKRDRFNEEGVSSSLVPTERFASPYYTFLLDAHLFVVN